MTQKPHPAKKWLLLLSCVFSLASQAQAPATAPVGNIAIAQQLSPHPVTTTGQAATALSDGRWLLTGGQGSNSSASTAAFLVDASGKVVVPLTAHLQQARSNHSATLLADGTVLLIGGVDASGNTITSAEQYNPATGVFTSVANTGLIPRSGHSATVISSGQVLIAGGSDSKGNALYDVELYTPGCSSCSPSHFPTKLDAPRIGASAALLPNGSVLLWSSNAQNGNGDLLDPLAQTITPVTSVNAAQLAVSLSSGIPAVSASQPTADAQSAAIDQPLMVRFVQRMSMPTLNSNNVTLLGPNGPVAIQVTPVEDGMLLFVTPQQSLLPAARYTLFIDSAINQNGQTLALTAIGFTTGQLNGTSSNGSGGTTLITALNTVGSTAIAVPAASTAATITNSATATAGTTTASTSSTVDDDSWHPQAADYHGLWISGRAELAKQHPPRHVELQRAFLNTELLRDGRIKARQREAMLPPVRQAAAAPGVTALVGQTLKLNGQPLAGVTVSMGKQSTVTDANGEFVLSNIPAGVPPAQSPMLQIDGRNAGNGSNGNQQYGRYFYQIHVKAGQVNGMTQPIWMTRLDTTHIVNIPSPTTQDTVISNPQLPGLEVHLPAGAVVRDADGKIVTQVSLTPVPADQLPFPMPYGRLPVYYTLQPGGAVIESATGKPLGAKVVYPNYSTQPPGAKFEQFDYDPRGRGWYVYGTATVATDGKRLISDKDFVLYQFSASSIASSGGNGSNRSPICKGGTKTTPNQGGDPVSCHDGYFTESYADLALSSTFPLAMQRSYVSGDANQHAFGVGGSDAYDGYLYFADASAEGNGYTVGEIDMIQGDGSSIPFYVVGSNNQYLDPTAVWQSTTPGQFYMAQLRISGSGGFGAPFTITTKDGSVFTFSYYQAQLQSIADRNGNSIGILRDSLGRKTQVDGSNGRSISFTYNVASCGTCVSQVKDSSGRQVSYAYDSRGYLTQVTDATGGITSYTYDTVTGNIATVRDPHNNAAQLTQPTTSNQYYQLSDGQYLNGRVKQQTDGNNGTTQFNYTFDANGNTTQTTVTDQLGNIRVLQYTTAGFIARETWAQGQPEQQTVTNVWNSTTNLLQSTTDALGRTTSYSYDGLGNVNQVTMLSGTVNAASSSFVYNSDNQVASITDPLQHTITLSYDSKGNLSQAKDANGNTVQYSINTAGQVTSITVAGNTINLSYDSADLIKLTDAQNHTFNLTPDNVGRTIQTTDALGNVSQTVYDAQNRVTQSIDPLKRNTGISYDGDSAVTQVTDANNHNYGYGYDALDNVTSYTDPLNQSEHYQYDLSRNATQITDRKGQASKIAYDHLNRPTSVTYADNSSVSYTYDAGNRITQVVDSQNGTISYQYDGFDHITSVTSTTNTNGSVSNTTSYTYYANGLRQSMTVNNQPTITYAYDAGNRLTQITQAAGAVNNNTAQTVSYSYDTANRRTQTVLPDGVAMNYSYDTNSNLTGISYTQGSNTLGNLSYGYDANGRRISVGGSFARTNPMPTNSSTVDVANRLTTFNGATLTYDVNGNLTNDGTNTYTWNARNQLIQISGPATTATFAYDAVGRRVSKTINGTTSNYVYDGPNIVGETNSGATFLTGLGIDETLAVESGNGTTTQIASYITDALGSTIRLADANGNKLVDYTYDLYGNTTADANVYNPFQYTGRENDGTGLYYYRARYYSPTQQRFISQDPLGLGGGINPYAYAGGDPVSFRDPTGHFAITAEIVVGAVIIGALWWEYTHPVPPTTISDPNSIPTWLSDPLASSASDRDRASRGAASIISKAQGRNGPNNDDDECDKQEKADELKCRSVPWQNGAQRACYMKAAIDAAACRAKKKNCP